MQFDFQGRKGLVWGLLVIAGTSGTALADTTIPQEYGKHITSAEAVGAIGTDLFGDQVNLYTGSTEFVTTDVSLPGNNGLPVSVGRRFAVKSREFDASWAPAPGMFRDWDLEIPHLHGVFPFNRPWQVFGSDNDLAARVKRCSVANAVLAKPPTTKGFGAPAGFFVASEYWQGNHLYVPGHGDQEMLFAGVNNTYKPTDGKAYYWTTQQRWAFSCLPNTAPGNNVPGEAFLAVAPDGTRYRFDWIVQRDAPTLVKPYDTGSVGDFAPSEPADAGGDVSPQFTASLTTALGRLEVWILPTRIEDRFGNYVNYTYDAANPWRLLKIVASDGRQLTLSYNADGDIQSVTDGTRTWRYTYSPYFSGWILSGVELPDQSVWAINFSGLNDAWIKPYKFGISNAASLCEDPAMWAESGQQAYVGTITHPSGAVGEFTFKPTEHGRSYVPKSCIKMTSDPTDPDAYAYQAYRFAAVSLRTKKITGPGLPTYQWNYTYGALNNSWSTCVGCPTTKTVEVAGPGDYRRYTFGNKYADNEGKLLKTETGSSSAAILRTENTTYLFDATGQSYPAQAGSSPNLRGDQAGERHVPVVKREFIQQGTTYVWQVNQTNGIYSFDNYVNPLSVTRSSAPGGYSRTDVTAYHHNTTKWVIGQVAKSTNSNTGLVETEAGYDGNTAQLRWTKSFGKLRQVLTYNADGTLLTAQDGNNNTATFANWKRGLPQKITFADTTFKTAVVNNLGGIDSVTDENGYKTCYNYDAMGRLAGITYPSEAATGVCDTSTWAKTTRSFARHGTAVYGLPAGHWVQSIVTGNGRQVTYFDALWRPVVATTYDNANIPGTLSQTVTRYDAQGRPTFVSYPQRELSAAVYNTWANPAIVLTIPGTDTVYDALGRVTTVTQDSELGALTTTTNYPAANADGPYTVVTNPRGFQTRTWYQAFDQPSSDAPVQIRHPEDAFTHIVRDVFGKPLTITRRRLSDAGLATTRSYAYNANQELCRTVEPETGATLLGYDLAGNMKWSSAGLAAATPCEPNGTAAAVAARRVDRTYDVRNRLKTLAFPDGLGDQTLTYTPDGLAQSIVTQNDGINDITNSYTYNRRRLPIGERLQWVGVADWNLGYSYTANGHLSERSQPGAADVSYAPNALGQPTRVGSFASGVSYHPNGAVKQFTYGNGLVHTLTQNERGLPDTSCDFTGTCTASAVLNDGYDYDQNGNVAAISDGTTGNRGNRTMSYDGLDRLTHVVSPMYGAEGANYAYDVLDNLIRVRIGGPAARDRWYCYDAKNQLTNLKTGSCAGTSVMGLGYDLQGNLNNRNGVTYTFDFGNRLRSSDAGAYVYDGYGLRVRDYVGGSKYSFYSRDGQLVYAYDLRQGNKTSVYYHLGSSLVAVQEIVDGNSVVKYQHTDALGSPVAVTDQNRVVIEKSEYEPYGKLINRPLKDGPGYTGHVADAATGLIYMQQRYYDDDLGKFPTVDPVTATSVGGNFNRYWYANNNPYRYYDPDGRSSCPGSSRGTCIQSDTYDASKSNGQTTQATESMSSAMVAQKDVVAVPQGGTQEKIGFVTPAENATAFGATTWGHNVSAADGATTASTSRTDSATAAVPAGAVAVIHGHIDGRTDGVISPGDAGPLKSGLPNGVVSQGRVGVTEILSGRLQFRMLEGKMSPHEVRELQKSLDKQQRQFMLPGDGK